MNKELLFLDVKLFYDFIKINIMTVVEVNILVGCLSSCCPQPQWSGQFVVTQGLVVVLRRSRTLSVLIVKYRTFSLSLIMHIIV